MSVEVIVCKFGGSSLSNSQQFKKVKEIIQADSRRQIVIPSAPGKSENDKHKITDLLLMCYQLASHNLHYQEIFDLVKNRYTEIRDQLAIHVDLDSEFQQIQMDIEAGADADYCASRGEYLNGKLLAAYLDYDFIDATEVIRLKDKKAQTQDTYQQLQSKINLDQKVVIPGFYGLNEDNKIETFSRGGSDVTGSLVAAGLKVYLYENWTDVSGFLVADPKIVSESLPIQFISYEELRELSYMGAPVLHEEAVFPVKADQIPIRILNTNRPQDFGTYIVAENSDLSQFIQGAYQPLIITGIAGKQNYSVIRVEKTHMTEDFSFYRKLISIFESNDIPIEHMPTSIDTISIVVHSQYLGHKLKKIQEEINIYCNPDRIVIQNDLAIIAVVGRGMVATQGTSSQLFTALAQAKVNIRMISQGSSEMNIIVGVNDSDFNQAIAAIYHGFIQKEES